MIQNKKFQNNESLEVVSIVGENGPFYSLSNGSNVKKDIFFQKYSELIPDAASFLSSQSASNLSSLADQLRSMDTSRVPNGDAPTQVVVKQQVISEPVPAPNNYKEMLEKRRRWEEEHSNLSDYKVYDDDEEAAADFDRKMAAMQQQQSRRQVPPQYQEQESLEYNQPEQNNIPAQPAFVSAEEEAFRFFRSFKKVFPITLTVDFEEKIAQPDFIKLMAVNYEGDIIKYYTKEFMNRIYNDPGFLENKVYEKLKEIVFAEPEKEKKTRTTKAKNTPSKVKPREHEIVSRRKNPKKESENNG